MSIHRLEVLLVLTVQFCVWLKRFLLCSDIRSGNDDHDKHKDGLNSAQYSHYLHNYSEINVSRNRMGIRSSSGGSGSIN